jgi:rod shape-determining protein MreD
MWRLLAAILPAMVCTLAALAACLPWGAPMVAQQALPLVAMGVVFFWAGNQPTLLPSPVVFLLGLLIDLGTAGPLGFWALHLLLAYAIAAYAPVWYAGRRDGPMAMALFCASVVLACLDGWVLSSLFALQSMPIRAFLISALLAMAAYPVLSTLMSPLDRMIGHRPTLTSVGENRSS